MINKIEKLLQEARTHVAVEVKNTLLRTYKEIGKLLVEDIDLHENEEKSGECLGILEFNIQKGYSLFVSVVMLKNKECEEKEKWQT